MKSKKYRTLCAMKCVYFVHIERLELIVGGARRTELLAIIVTMRGRIEQAAINITIVWRLVSVQCRK